MPRPKNKACSLSAKSFAISLISLSSFKTSSIIPGKWRNCLTTFASLSGGRPKRLANTVINKVRATSCVVKAFVEATPISGPALVIKQSSDSRTKELSGTLQIARLYLKPISFALRNAAKVSAVSPDCEIVINNVSGWTTTVRYRNSLATSILQGKLVTDSMPYFAINPAW